MTALNRLAYLVLLSAVLRASALPLTEEALIHRSEEIGAKAELERRGCLSWIKGCLNPEDDEPVTQPEAGPAPHGPQLPQQPQSPQGPPSDPNPPQSPGPSSGGGPDAKPPRGQGHKPHVSISSTFYSSTGGSPCPASPIAGDSENRPYVSVTSLMDSDASPPRSPIELADMNSGKGRKNRSISPTKGAGGKKSGTRSAAKATIKNASTGKKGSRRARPKVPGNAAGRKAPGNRKTGGQVKPLGKSATRTPNAQSKRRADARKVKGTAKRLSKAK